jgi:hypothetical protein
LASFASAALASFASAALASFASDASDAFASAALASTRVVRRCCHWLIFIHRHQIQSPGYCDGEPAHDEQQRRSGCQPKQELLFLPLFGLVPSLPVAILTLDWHLSLKVFGWKFGESHIQDRWRDEFPLWLSSE